MQKKALDKLQLRTTLGWSFQLVQLSGFGPLNERLNDSVRSKKMQ